MIFVCLHQPNVTAKTKLAGIENALPSVEGIYFYICLLYFVISCDPQNTKQLWMNTTWCKKKKERKPRKANMELKPPVMVVLLLGSLEPLIYTANSMVFVVH